MNATTPRSWTLEQQELLRREGRKLAYPRVAVTADAGSGKTSVLVARIETILSELGLKTHERVLCVSFTERSATDLKNRLNAHNAVEVYTIHGFCARVIQEFGSLKGLSPLLRILDESESLDFFYKCFEKVYRRQPPQSLSFSSDQIFDLCRMARSHQSSHVKPLQYEDEEQGVFVQTVLDEMAHLKERQDVLEYADLEKLAAELLSLPQVCQTLHHRYRHVFVDEFQDTSEVQCQLVKQLVSPEASLFVVGDVKQSIYRFRGADVAVFEKFVAELPSHKRLSVNFRSVASVVEAVNLVSRGVIPGYEDMKAFRGEDASSSRVVRLETESEAQGILQMVQRLQTQGIALADIVLLLPRLKGHEILLSELKRAGLGLVMGGGTDLLSHHSLRALANLWIWACEPWQVFRKAQVAVDLLQGRRDLPQSLERLTPPDYDVTVQSSEEFLEVLNNRFHLQKNLGIFFEQFRLYILQEASQGARPALIAQMFTRMLQEGGEAARIPLLPPPENIQGSLRVMTVHGSKGLEFPYVILADLAGRKSRLNMKPFLPHGPKIFIKSRDEEGELHKSPAYEEALAAETTQDLAESARLLYVAMTRAEEGLCFVDTTPFQKRKTENTWARWVAPQIESIKNIEEWKSSNGILKKETQQKSEKQPPLEESPPVYHRARVGVTSYLSEIADLKTTGEKISQRSGRKDAVELGVKVHELLEREDWQMLREYSLEQKIPLEKFWIWQKSEQGRSIFEPEAGKRIFSEFAFDWKTQDTVLTGRLDRLVVWPQSSWVIDYKVLLSPRSRGEIVDAYSEQLRLYGDAVKALTGVASVRLIILDVCAAGGAVCVEV